MIFRVGMLVSFPILQTNTDFERNEKQHAVIVRQLRESGQCGWGVGKEEGGVYCT